MKLNLEIITPEGKYFDGQVDLINIFTSSGNLTILANHIPLITNINISHLYYKNDEEKKEFAISGGTLFVSETKCSIITNAIESKDEIDIERANNAKSRAENRINSKDDNIDLKRANVALLRAINRISLIR